MTESSVRLAQALALTKSEREAMNLLVAAPVLHPADLVAVARHPSAYGIEGEVGRRLERAAEWLVEILGALTGEHSEAVPASTYFRLAMISRLQGKIDQARRFYSYSFANAQSPQEKAQALSGTAILEFQQGNNSRARKVFNQARDICDRGNVGGTMLANILSNLGSVEMDEKNWPQAAELFERVRVIGMQERLPDIYALARVNQAELARRQGDKEAATRLLDDVRWVEGSGSGQEEGYRAVRGSIADSDADGTPDPEKSSIEELENWLQRGGLAFSAVSGIERAHIQQGLAEKYFARRDGRRIENVQAAVSYWESALAYLEHGKVGDKPVGEIVGGDPMKAMIAGLHASLGLAYNEWFALDSQSGSTVKAAEHFQAALKTLPNTPQYADSRRSLLNNLANSQAWNARRSTSWLTAGVPDSAALNRTLNAQSELLPELADEPVLRCQVLVNIAMTYQELAEASRDAGRDSYYPAAWDCACAAERALRGIEDGNPELVLGVAGMKAQIAWLMRRADGELLALRQRLDVLLRNLNLDAIKPSIWGLAIRANAKLALGAGQTARAYRTLLIGMRRLRHRSATLRLSLDTAASDLRRTNTDLVEMLCGCNQLDRAAFYAGTNPFERPRQYSRGRGWGAASGIAVIFEAISTSRYGAFVITPEGVQMRELPIHPLEAIRVGGQFLSAKVASEEGDASPASNEKWRNAMDGVAAWISQNFFAPIIDLLGKGGPLILIPDALARRLPLHLAADGQGRVLLDRFEVTYCAHLRFEGAAAAELPREGEVFIAGYSPEEARLPFTALEVAAMARRHPRDARTVSGAAATPAAVLQGIARSRLAHLCSHGSFDWGSPLDSRLVFAGRDLSLREIQLSLASSLCGLIVLSACEAGARALGPDEASFASVLLRAGCGAVIAADWRVDDLSTAVLMDLMHGGLAAGVGPAEALAKAQRAIQSDTGGVLADRARAWFEACDGELAEDERAYVQVRLETLAARQNEIVFAHPAFWGSFSANSLDFEMRRRPRARS